METTTTKAFFLGALTAQNPMSFNKAVDEIFVGAPEAKNGKEEILKTEWDKLSGNLKTEMSTLMKADGLDDIEFLKLAQESMDYYLTGLSLAGTNMETCKNEELADLLDEMEDVVLDLEEYIQEEKFQASETKEFKEVVVSLWNDVVETTF